MSVRTEGLEVASKVDSAALGRLIAEVSVPGRPIVAAGYNRSYNRHNR